MVFFKKIKYELFVLIILTVNILLSYKLDVYIYNHYLKFEKSLGFIYLKEFFVNITELGNSVWYFVLSIFFLFFFYINNKFFSIEINNLKRKISFFISIIIHLLAVGVITQILKHIVGRPRPNYANTEVGFDFNFFTLNSNFHSFPSGHSSTVFMICFIMCAALPKFKYFIVVLTMIVAFSRVVVGAHFFTDVLAGALLALAVFRLTNYLLKNNYKKYQINEFIFSNNHFYYTVIFFFSLSLFLSVGPSLDLYVANLFYNESSNFYLQSNDILSFIFRELLIPAILLFVLVLPIVSKLFKIKSLYFGYSFSFREISLIWVSQVITILVFVNLFLKNFWGRARPDDILEFGGDKYFSPWYKLTDSCETNCSFVSGDASVGFSFIILYFITKKSFYIYLGIIFGFLLGYIRIIAGAHFFSDVVFSGIFVIFLNFFIFKLYEKYVV